MTLFIIIIWSFNKKLDSFTDGIFIFASIAAFVSIFLDIMCQFVASEKYFAVDYIWKIVTLKAYLISIPTYIYAIALYINKISFPQSKYIKIRLILFFVLVADAIVICLLNSSFEYYEKCSIPIGPSTLFTYISCFVFAVALLIELLVHKKRLDKWPFFASILWILSFLLGGVFQFILINIIYTPVVSLFVSIGILLLYTVVENPGNKFDYDANCFHYESFIKYITEVIDSKEIQTVLFVSMSEKNTGSLYYIKQVFKELVFLYERKNNIKIFSGYSDELIVTAKDFVDIQNVASNISRCMFKVEKENQNKASFNASILLFPDISYIDSYQLLRTVFDAYKASGSLTNESISIETIDEQKIIGFKKDINIANEIDEAFKNDRVVLEYQPLTNKDPNKAIDVEAVAVIKNDNGKILYPIDYYMVAEKYNRYLQIDDISFRKVCKTIYKISKSRNKLGVVLVRVSVQALEKEEICQEFIDITINESVSRSNICFEITNASAILQKEKLLKNIALLQKEGFSFAIGGFGSGESNLNYFIDLPMQIVKFDQSVLDNAVADKKAAMIMKDVTDLAHALDFKVVAVGIKNSEEKKFVDECGIEMMIGNYFSPLISENNFIDMVTMKEDIL